MTRRVILPTLGWILLGLAGPAAAADRSQWTPAWPSPRSARGRSTPGAPSASSAAAIRETPGNGSARTSPRRARTPRSSSVAPPLNDPPPAIPPIIDPDDFEDFPVPTGDVHAVRHRSRSERRDPGRLRSVLRPHPSLLGPVAGASR